MKTALLLTFAFLVWSGDAQAQNIAGRWQGVLHADKDLRIVLTVTKAKNGRWDALFYSPDDYSERADTSVGIPVHALTQQAGSIRFSVAGGRYEGMISPDRKSIAGIWKQDASLPLNFQRATKKTTWILDTSPHRIRFIAVDKNVRLEVLDWGGTGSPLVFLAGLGNTAHEFDSFALEFAATHHVYAITRRGYGNSSMPDPATADYSADRLGDDVLAVIDALKLDRPVLAGHSLAGEELSSIGSRHPEKVAGLIYLDAGYTYAYYSPGDQIPFGDDLIVASKDLREELAQLGTLPARAKDLEPIIQHLREVSLPQFEKDLSVTQTSLQALPPPPANPPPPPTLQVKIGIAIVSGARKYTDIKVPILALFAVPPLLSADMPSALRAEQIADVAAQVDAFEAGLPAAHVVRLPSARHALWMTNEADVLREMNAFMAGLK